MYIEPASKSGRQSVFVLVGEGDAFVVCHVLRVFFCVKQDRCVSWGGLLIFLGYSLFKAGVKAALNDWYRGLSMLRSQFGVGAEPRQSARVGCVADATRRRSVLESEGTSAETSSVRGAR